MKPLKCLIPLLAVRHVLVCLMLAASLSGCNPLMLAGILIGGPPSIEPHFDATTKKSMTDKGVTVAVVCVAPDEVLLNFDGMDRELAKAVSYRLWKKKIKVVDPDHVQAWLDENSEWDTAAEIGRALGVTYVIYIDLYKFSLYEENSFDLYRGRSNGMISVYEIEKQGGSTRIYKTPLSSKFPRLAPRSAYRIPRETFKLEYLSRLSEEIGRLFCEWYKGDLMPDAT